MVVFGLVDETKIWHSLTFHHFGLILSAIFGLIAVVMSFYLMYRHATHYLKPAEQRQYVFTVPLSLIFEYHLGIKVMSMLTAVSSILRVIFMVPVYAVVSFLSYLYYKKTVYFQVLRDCYEAFAIASFFTLLCCYIAPDLHNQKDFFRGIRPRPWLLPLSWFDRWCNCGGIWRTPRSGLTWFNVGFLTSSSSLFPSYSAFQAHYAWLRDCRWYNPYVFAMLTTFGRSSGRASFSTALLELLLRFCRSSRRPLGGIVRTL